MLVHLALHFLAACLVPGVVTAMNLRDVEEGPCTGLDSRPQILIDTEWLSKIPDWFVSAGSKYQMYRITLHHFDDRADVLENMSEYRLYYEACFTSKVNLTEPWGVSPTYGFEAGRVSFQNHTAIGPGIVDYAPVPKAGYDSAASAQLGTSRHYITLTDNKSFVFSTVCNFATNVKSWNVLTTTRRLSRETIHMIEDHALQQGFHPANFIFLRYESCQPGTGVIENERVEGEHDWLALGRRAGGYNYNYAGVGHRW